MDDRLGEIGLPARLQASEQFKIQFVEIARCFIVTRIDVRSGSAAVFEVLQDR